MISNRQRLEELEDQVLAGYAIRSQRSQGRAHAESEPDYRTCFQRDRDRILHTTAFRRLEYKTQVFINDEGDYYRTRLTHTLEVAQIGRSIARALAANEDLVESICLAHDLGHPPFGHSGETCLSRLMRDHGGFEHNRQSLRIVTELEQRYPDFSGLNLSWEVLEGIIKHETEYDHTDARDFNPNLRAHMEAQIVNIADQFAYSAHDLDDGLHSGIISVDMVENLELWAIITHRIGWENRHLDDLSRHQIIRELIGMEITDLIRATEQKLLENRVRTVDELQRLPYNVVGFSEDMHRRNRELTDFLYKQMYRHYRVVRMAMKAERIVTDLFKAYQAQPLILPSHVQPVINERGLERTICDYIAGMTDRFAIEEYQKLFNPAVLP
ncbi:MAG: deoxyguanosinetriphosphate triphosphohydrolase [Anaerolineaceae bacterium]|nr:deoxyguanosinetriphosphate triphosphohydrolase [Anaerolineaceae bacterium]